MREKGILNKKEWRYNMKKIGIISDTHGVLREEVLMHLEGCDVIIHGGDIGSLEIIDRLRQIAPLFVVRGNNDQEDWANEIPEIKRFEIEGIRFLLIHNRKEIKGKLAKEEVDIVIFGHSHKYYNEVEEDIRYFNPGSCGRKRFGLPLTMGILKIENGAQDYTQIDL